MNYRHSAAANRASGAHISADPPFSVKCFRHCSHVLPSRALGVTLLLALPSSLIPGPLLALPLSCRSLASCSAPSLPPLIPALKGRAGAAASGQRPRAASKERLGSFIPHCLLASLLQNGDGEGVSLGRRRRGSPENTQRYCQEPWRVRNSN